MPSRNENRIIRKNEVRNDGRDRMITDRKDAALSGNFPGFTDTRDTGTEIRTESSTENTASDRVAPALSAIVPAISWPETVLPHLPDRNACRNDIYLSISEPSAETEALNISAALPPASSESI